MNTKPKFLHCVDNLDNFTAEKYNQLSIGVEIDFSNTNVLDGEWEKIVNEYRKKLDGFTNIISVHGVAFDLNPGSPDKKVVELTKYRYKQCVNIAKLLNASYVVFHSQINPWIRDKKVLEIKANRQIDFWKEIADEIGDNKLKALVENVYEDDYSDLLMLAEKINSDKIKVCLDTGHVLSTSKQSLDEWVKNLKPYIELIHLHWNNGSYDAHNAPDEEELKIFKQIYESNSLECIAALEYNIDDIEKEIRRVRNYLK
jgi:sugar phosphate isomerase/epimerase